MRPGTRWAPASLSRSCKTTIKPAIPDPATSALPAARFSRAKTRSTSRIVGPQTGGQVQVEILDVSLSPARFITDYIAGLYHRPLLMPEQPKRLGETIKLMPNAPKGLAALYVNRGLGTVGAPVRLGAPPEITHIVLRSA